MSTWSDCAERWALDAAALLLAGVAAPLLLLVLLLLPALRLRIPYGRYGSRSWGPGLPPRLAWVVQELPALAVPVWLISWHGAAAALPGDHGGDVYPGGPLVPWPNRVLLAMFIGHYFQRTWSTRPLVLCTSRVCAGHSSTPSSSAERNPCRSCPSSSPWRFAPSMATCRAARSSRALATPTAGSTTSASSQNSTVFANGLQMTPLHQIVSHDPRLVSWISNEFVEGQAGG
ncbi:uncharacterized protein LOC144727665 isoform X3 [Lampetra planeri]